MVELTMSDAYAASMASALPLVQVRPLLRRVYLYMAFGLAVTAVVSYWTVTSPAVLSLILTNYWLFWVIFIAQLIMVAVLSARVMSLSTSAALGIFLVYAALNGFTLSGLVLTYGLGTLAPAFVTTAALFAAMTIVATVTTLDLTRVGTFAIMGVIGLILAMLVNLFVRNSGFDLLISVLGVILFTALTASDTQKIQRWASDPRIAAGGEAAIARLGVLGALMLYLDFLNLFIFLVRIFGRGRN
jgi:FtsH-binding integral membrane protein